MSEEAAPAENSTPESSGAVEFSVVLPCLDEAETLATCIRKIQQYFGEAQIAAEVVVADNGSDDGSQQIARDLGARVIDVPRKGYGSALRGGIDAARGTYVLMGDADDSYDFSKLDDFVRELRAGNDLVMGNRFAGGILPGAMPWLHYWIGNPILTAIGRIFFRSPMGDFHCGLRGFRKEAYQKMQLRSQGMEFASEMVIKSTLLNLKMVEVPIVLHPDGRTRSPHLRTWRDGWRHLRFMLLFSPRWLFLIPGVMMFVAGLVISAVLVKSSVVISGVEFDIQTLYAASLLCLLGYQLIIFAMFTKAFAVTEGFHPPPSYYSWIFNYFRLETGVVAGLITALAGFATLWLAVEGWRDVGFGGLDPRETMRQVVPGGVLMMLGVQTIYSSFFLSILGLERD
ncbi:MAG: glycosyltransferase involved in cell wall biosynthesis [Myxococcota bacterium]